MLTYSEAVVKTSKIATDIERHRHTLLDAYGTIQQTAVALAAMEGGYGTFVNELSAQDGADPDWAALQGKTDKLVQNFLTLKAYALAVQAAVEGVE